MEFVGVLSCFTTSSGENVKINVNTWEVKQIVTRKEQLNQNTGWCSIILESEKETIKFRAHVCDSSLIKILL